MPPESSDVPTRERRCPVCGQSYPAGVVICIDCGLDLRTGTHLETHIGTYDQAGAPGSSDAATISRAASASGSSADLAPTPTPPPPVRGDRSASAGGSLPGKKTGPPGGVTPEKVRGRPPRARPAAMPGPVVQVVARWVPGLLRPGLVVLAAACLGVGLTFLAFCAMILALAPISAVPMGALGFVLYAQAVAMLLSARIEILHEILVEFGSGEWWLFLFLVFGPVLHFVVVMGLSARL